MSAGYDFQLGPRWVLGIFADYAFGEVDGNIGQEKHVIDKQWAIGSRIGLLATPSTLLYASGGYARADFKAIDAEEGVAFFNKTLNGFFVGLGVEQAINRNLSVAIDYRLSDYQNVTFDGFGGLNFDNDVHAVRIGVNWRFGRDAGH